MEDVLIGNLKGMVGENAVCVGENADRGGEL